LVHTNRAGADGFYLIAENGASFFDYSKARLGKGGLAGGAGFRVQDSKGTFYFMLLKRGGELLCTGDLVDGAQPGEPYGALDITAEDCAEVQAPRDRSLLPESEAELFRAMTQLLTEIPRLEIFEKNFPPLFFPGAHIARYPAPSNSVQVADYLEKFNRSMNGILEACSGLGTDPDYQGALEGIRRFRSDFLSNHSLDRKAPHDPMPSGWLSGEEM
jgi:hypothetical protein